MIALLLLHVSASNASPLFGGLTGNGNVPTPAPTPPFPPGGLWGSSDCRCINPWKAIGGAPPNLTFVQHDGIGCLSYMEGNSQFCYPLDYGAKGCRAYDVHLQPFCADALGHPLPTAQRSCSKAWCFVNQSACSLVADLSVNYGFHKSYETCENMDKFTEQDLKLHLRGMTLRVGVLRSKQPRPCYTMTSSGPSGWLPDILNSMAQAWKFKVEWVNVSKEYFETHQEESTHCAKDVAMGKMDLCGVCMVESPERLVYTTFSPPLVIEDMYLVVPMVEEDLDNIWKAIAKCFEPFTPLLWLAIGLTCIVVGSAMTLIGDVEEPTHDYGKCGTKVVRLTRGILGTFLAFFGRGGLASSFGGKVVMFGFHFFAVIGIAAYTANLASIQTIALSGSQINSVADAVKLQKTMCLTQEYHQLVAGRYPAAAKLLKDPAFAGTSAEGMFSGICDLAILTDPEYANLKAGVYGGDFCKKTRIEEIVAKVIVGVPVNQKFLRPLGYHLAHLRFTGQLAQAIAKYPPPHSKCPDPTFLSPTGLEPKHLSRILFMVGACVVLGVIISRLEIIATRCEVKAADFAKSEGRKVDQKIDEIVEQHAEVSRSI